MDRFLVCLPYTLDQERVVKTSGWGDPRNFSDDKRDPGGATQDGITQAEYDKYRASKQLPTRSVRLITEAEGEDIYRGGYWLPHCPLLPPGLDLQVFDAEVNEGAGEGIKILQYVLNITIDGEWGNETAQAAANIKDVVAAVKAFTARRSEVYRETRNFETFGKDWERRTAEIGAIALQMAAATVVAAPFPAPPIKTGLFARLLAFVRSLA